MNFSKEDISKWKNLKLELNNLKYGYYFQWDFFSSEKMNLFFTPEYSKHRSTICVFVEYTDDFKWIGTPKAIMEEFVIFLIKKRYQLKEIDGVCYGVSYVAKCLDEALFNFSENDSNADTVNHPHHYNTASVECIDLMQELYGTEAVKSFCKCNALKYLYRADSKNGLEDIKKATWYLNKIVEVSEND